MRLDFYYQMKIITMGLVLTLLGCSTSSKKEQKADIYYNHGTHALTRGKHTEALEHLQKAYDLNKDDPRIHNNLAMAYYFKKHYTMAIHHLKIAIKLNPKDSNAKNNLAGIYFHQNKLNLALDLYKKIAKDLTYKHQYRVFYNMALIHLRQKRQFEGISFLKKSLKENEKHCPSLFQLGLIYFENQDFETALKNFQGSSRGQCFERPAPHFYQGLTYLKLKKYYQARDKFKHVQQNFPSAPYALKAQQHLKFLRTNQIIRLEAQKAFTAEQLDQINQISEKSEPKSEE